MNLGSNIRTIRKRKRITIAQICEETGLSQGFLSQVETNKTSPSIATLENIAQALQVPLAYLLLQKEDSMSIVRKEERMTTTTGTQQLKVEHLSSSKNMKMMIVEFPPGSSIGDEPHAHEGEEVHVVLQGRIYAEHGDTAAYFNAGDSFSWPSCIPHAVKNVGDEVAIILITVYNDSNDTMAFL